MQIIEGEDLSVIVREGPIPPDRAARILQPVARAVAHAHRSGVIHRDLKPRNILVDRLDRPFVTDFGLAKILGGDRRLTIPGELLGSPPYMAPEQIRDSGRVGPACDIYALGATLYELITGRPPFSAANPYETLQQVVDGQLIRPRALNPAIPRDLETICLKCLETEPGSRYAEADQLAEDLGRFLNGQPITASPLSLWRRTSRQARRRPMLTSMTALGILAATALAGGWMILMDRERHHAEARALADRRQAETTRRQLYDAEMERASEVFAKGRVEQARQILEAHRPAPGQADLRGFEWYYLWRAANRDLALRGHDGSIRKLAFSPDGKTLASAGADRSIRLWDPATWSERRAIRGHQRLVSDLAFSPDGSTLYSGSYDGSILRWDPSSGQPRGSVRAGLGSLLCMALSPDGHLLAASTGEKTYEITCINPETGALVRALRGHPMTAWVIQFTPDGKTIAAGGDDGIVTTWDANLGSLSRATAGDPGGATNLVVTRDGASMISAGLNRSIRFHDARTGAAQGTLESSDPSAITSMAIGDDDRTLAVGHRGVVALWDRNDRRLIGEWRGHAGAVRGLAFSPGTAVLASGGDDGIIRLWDPKANRAIPSPGQPADRWAGVSGLPATPHCLAFSPDGLNLAVGFGDGSVEVRDRASGTIRHRLSIGPSHFIVRSVHFSRDGSRLMASGSFVPARIWRLSDGQEFPCPRDPEAEPLNTWWSIASTPDEKTLFVARGQQGKPSAIDVWDLADNRRRASLPGHSDYVRSLAITPDGKTLVSGAGDETVGLWDLSGIDPPAFLQGHRGQVFSVAVDPKGRWFASGSEDQAVKVWDLASRREVVTLKDHRAPVHAVAFTPDGQRLAAGARDGSILLWDTASFRVVARLEGHTHRINQLEFSPDGRTLASIGYDNSIQLRDAGPLSAKPGVESD